MFANGGGPLHGNDLTEVTLATWRLYFNHLNRGQVRAALETMNGPGFAEEQRPVGHWVQTLD